jgi:hypothetical protein
MRKGEMEMIRELVEMEIKDFIRKSGRIVL